MRRIAVLALLLNGCASATMISAPGSPAGGAYAPVNEAARPGLVRYLNQGMESVRLQRRQDAYRKMHAACGGQYRIDAEGPRTDGGFAVPMYGGGTMWQETEYWYIQFSCQPSAVAAR